MKEKGRRILSVILTAVTVFALMPVIGNPMVVKAEDTPAEHVAHENKDTDGSNHSNWEKISSWDDLESLGYVWLYLLRGSLPWMGLSGRDRKQKYDRICEVKAKTSFEDLCSGYPNEFVRYFYMIRQLGFSDPPEYSKYRQLFRDLFIRLGYTYDYNYDWVKQTPEPPKTTIPVSLPNTTFANTKPFLSPRKTIGYNLSSENLSRDKTKKLEKDNNTERREKIVLKPDNLDTIETVDKSEKLNKLNKVDKREKIDKIDKIDKTNKIDIGNIDKGEKSENDQSSQNSGNNDKVEENGRNIEQVESNEELPKKLQRPYTTTKKSRESREIKDIRKIREPRLSNQSNSLETREPKEVKGMREVKTIRETREKKERNKPKEKKNVFEMPKNIKTIEQMEEEQKIGQYAMVSEPKKKAIKKDYNIPTTDIPKKSISRARNNKQDPLIGLNPRPIATARRSHLEPDYPTTNHKSKYPTTTLGIGKTSLHPPNTSRGTKNPQHPQLRPGIPQWLKATLQHL